MKAQTLEITHFVENLDRGGLERVVIDLALAQQAAGYRCRVLCVFHRGMLADELEAAGVEVAPCDKRLGADVAALLRMRGLLGRQRGGILHTHNATAHYLAVLAGMGLGFDRVVNTRHGMATDDPRSRREWLYRRAMRNTDCVVGVSEVVRERLEQLGVRPRGVLTSVPNGIPVQRFAPASPEARAALADELRVAPGTRIVGTVGRLHPAKDQAMMIRAFRSVLEHVPEAVLVIVGDGALRAELGRVARDEGVSAQVRFLGDRGDVHRLLRGFDVFALSSVTEGYSIALLEASATGLPIVATRVGGNAEIVRDQVSGFLVAPSAEAAFTAALVRVLQEPELAAAMSRTARDWALANGSLEAMVERYEGIYAGRAA